MRSNLIRFFAFVIVLAMVVSPVSAQITPPPEGPRRELPTRSTDLPEPVDGPHKEGVEPSMVDLKPVDMINYKEPGRYIVTFPEEPLATYKAPGIQAQSGKLDVNSPQSVAYVDFLKSQQQAYLADTATFLKRTPEVLFQYQYATNGVSMILTPEEAKQLADRTGWTVRRVSVEHPDTDEGPVLIGAPAIWTGETYDDTQTLGEGIIVGIIDTGINFDHPSFSDTPVDGYTYSAPPQYYGVCDPTNTLQYDSAYDAACNDKLIGAFTYVKADPDEIISPEDSEGHGSHTASTVAGNGVNVVYQGVETTISGVAPHAQIVSFDVCVPTPPNGACYGDATVKAVDDAIAIGVDVINYSISGGSNPYNDDVELAFLDATEAGIFVSTSAGNAGDSTGASSVAHRSPWVSTVAASTTARIFGYAVDVVGTAPEIPPELIGMAALASGPVDIAKVFDGPIPIQFSEENLWGCVPFPAGYFTDSVALIKRGGPPGEDACAFVDKVANAYDAGATYVFIYNNRSGPPGGMDITQGAAMLDNADGEALKAFIEAHPSEPTTVDVHDDPLRITNPAWEDIVASFSSFGPNTTFDVLKPDITGPGVNILAAVADATITPSTDIELDLYQGTSMSSPHNAGSAALLMALHPDWTPSEVRSAMMMTADDGLMADRSAWGEGVRAATPQDEGSGRISLEDTALIGLVMSETIANFESADPASGGDPAALNLASLYESQCVGTCSWTRTLTSVADVSATYTVAVPDWMTVDVTSFTLALGESQTLTFTADASLLDAGVWAYGSVEMTTDALHVNASPVSDLHIPVAVMPSVSNIPSAVIFNTYRDADSGSIEDLRAVEITGGSVWMTGLAKGILDTFNLDPDPTPGEVEDDATQLYVKKVTVPAWTIRLVAEITATTSSDIDMFLYWDWDGDGEFSFEGDYLVAQSATSTALEYIEAPMDWVIYPAVDTYFVVVQNWAGAAGDSVTLSTGLVPDYPPAGNYNVEMPATNPYLNPFSLDIAWDEDTEEGDRLYGYFETFAAADFNFFLGGTYIDIRRGPDDVVKTADVDTAQPGDTITYTIEVNNYTTEALEYAINDVLPDGVTYVDGSVDGAAYDEVTNAITWTGTVDPVYRDYVVSTSAEDPNCSLGLWSDEDPTDAYLDLKSALGYNTNSGISGDGIWGTVFSTWQPFNYYGIDYVGLEITDDARVGFAMDGYDYINTPFPTPSVPNNTLGLFWDDFYVQYDKPTNKGVTLVGNPNYFGIIEYDDVELYDSPGYTMDVEVLYWMDVDDTPGAYEFAYAYDNITPGFFGVASGTIGMENANGTVGTTVSFNDPTLAIADGSAICFDWHQFGQPHVITFQVTVNEDASGVISNEAVHDNDHDGTRSETAVADVNIATFLKFYFPFVIN